MAVDTTPLLVRRTSLLAKIETTTGTAISLADTDGAFNAYNVRWIPNVEIVERLAQAGLGTLASIHGMEMAGIDFEIDFVGKGSSGAPTWATTFLTTSGFNASGGVFTTGYAASQPTLTLGAYFDGVKHAIAGAVGSVVIPYRTGFPTRLQFSYMGKMVADADVALVTPVGLSTLPPRLAGNSVTFGSYAPKLSSVQISVNNTIEPREDQSDSTAIRSCVIVDRRILVTADPEDDLAANRAWYTLMTGHTSESMSLPIGTAANNTITAACTSNLQWTAIPTGERGGKRTREVSGQINNDGLSITFT